MLVFETPLNPTQRDLGLKALHARIVGRQQQFRLGTPARSRWKRTEETVRLGRSVNQLRRAQARLMRKAA